jgi:hypothetical protein
MARKQTAHIIQAHYSWPKSNKRFGVSVALLLLALASPSFLLAQASHKQPFNQVGHTTIHPQELTQSVQLVFESDDVHDGFTRIRFLSGTKAYEIVTAYKLHRLNPRGDSEGDTQDFNVPSLPLDKSRYFRIGHYSDSNGEHTLLFFMGAGSASDADPLLVIGFNFESQPYKVLEKENLEVTFFRPSTADKPALVIGKPTLSQIQSKNVENPMSGPYASTYDPFAVYVLPTRFGKATYSLEESRIYNQHHYFWAGPHSSESTLIYYNIPGRPKPFAAPASDFDKIIP